MRYKPMLAYPVSDKPINYDDKVFMQPKLDGVRCLIQYDKKTGVTAWSRTGKQWKNIHHITSSLEKWFKSNQTTVLDGELYNHDLRDDFEKIVSLVRKQKPKPEDRKEARKLIQYHVYDYCMAVNNKLNLLESDMNRYEKRMHQLVCSDMYGKHIRYVPSRGVHSLDKAKEIHNDFLEKGYEGSILRLDGPYKCGRSYDLMKFKDFSDTEATIIGYELGKGKRTGTLGKFIMLDDEGVEFGCPPGKGYSYKDLAEMLENVTDYIGKRATFTYFQRTQAGSYRHPLFKCIRNYE